jgi:hypothetical protein
MKINNGPSREELTRALCDKRCNAGLTFELSDKETRKFTVSGMVNVGDYKGYIVMGVWVESEMPFTADYDVSKRKGKIHGEDPKVGTVNPAEEHQRTPEGEPAEQVMLKKTLRVASGRR